MKFPDQARDFRRFLRTVPAPPAANGTKAALLVAPWVMTPVPWYAVALACLYRARGRRPTLVFDDLPPPNPAERSMQITEIAGVLADCGLEVRRLSELPEATLHDGDAAELSNLARMNATAYLRRSGVTEVGAGQFFLEALTSRLKRFHTLAAEQAWDHFCIPGGLYGSSGAMRLAGQRAGFRVASYDSGPGSMTLGTDWIAGHCRDVAKIGDPRYADYIAAHRDRALELAREEFELRRTARDRYGYATTAYQANPANNACDVLVPMNVFDDAAGLGRSRFFADGAEWINETVDFLMRSTDARVTVREHPGARRLGRQDLIGPGLRERYGSEPRFSFISCHDPVSTYALLESARVVLPLASTVGVEAAALGKRVVIESDVYYAGLGFVECAESREDYFVRIQRALDTPGPLDDAARETAWLAYFFGQVSSFVDCEFTPQPVDFKRWVRRDFSELAADPKVKIVVTAMSEGIPSWRLQSEQIFAGEYRVPVRSAPPAEQSWWRRMLAPVMVTKSDA
ncbi:MAG: hypothetical protein P4L99_00335 [Chthoniobacter sp.]|nr:hypothetical protein [Chthoniobacter sp.]